MFLDGLSSNSFDLARAAARAVSAGELSRSTPALAGARAGLPAPTAGWKRSEGEKRMLRRSPDRFRGGRGARGTGSPDPSMRSNPRVYARVQLAETAVGPIAVHSGTGEVWSSPSFPDTSERGDHAQTRCLWTASRSAGALAPDARFNPTESCLASCFWKRSRRLSSRASSSSFRGGPRNWDSLLRWDPDPGEGVWHATEETEFSC